MFTDLLGSGDTLFLQTEGSDYMNANFLDGHNRHQAYIATQVSYNFSSTKYANKEIDR